MLELYEKSILNEFKRRFNYDESKDAVVNIYFLSSEDEDNGELTNGIKENKIGLPVILLRKSKDGFDMDKKRTTYTTITVSADKKSKTESCELNLDEFVPIKPNYYFSVIADKMNEKRELVEKIVSSFSETCLLTVKHPSDENKKIQFGISVDGEQEISDSSLNIGDRNLHESLAALNCEGCVLPVDEVVKKAMGDSKSEATENKSDNSYQVEVVKKTLDFMKTMLGWAEYVSDEIDVIELPWGETFEEFSNRGEPAEPELKEVNRVYPEIVVPTTDNLLTVFSKTRQNRRAAEIAAVQNSPEYQAKCAELNRGYYAQEQENKAIYEKEKETYDTITLPEYQKKCAVVEKLVEERSDQLNAELEKHIKDNETLNETKVIPLPYVEIEILEYLYEVMSTSNYDIHQAIEMYDRNEQRKIDEKNLREQQRANQLAQEAAYYDEPTSQSSGGGFLSGVLQGAAGAAIGTSSLKKESRKQTQLMEEQASRERERDRQADIDRYRAEVNANMARSNVIKENEERRRKGLPLKPLPPGR